MYPTSVSRPATLLRLLIAAHMLWTVLLTPAAFETRPFSSFTTLGFISLVLIFTTVGLEITAFIIVGRRPRLAGLLASIGPFLFVGPFLVDRFGLFSSYPAPAVIALLEVIALATQITILLVARRLRA